MNQAPQTANATYSATLCDQWWADGLRAAFIAPGSRSTPVALALVEHAGIETHVFHDERAASFAALGHGLATGSPALVLCSSGTAGAHFYAAVIEADAAAVPLIVVTADRPPELWGRGAPQTIDQTNLYGSRVRDFVEPGPPDELDPADWRPLARRFWHGATGATPGPVHANLSFRDPLTGTPGELPPPLDEQPLTSSGVVAPETLAELVGICESARGVIVAGRHQSDPQEVQALATLLGWPVIADHRSGCRAASSSTSIRYFDSLLRAPGFTSTHRPDVVLRLGEIVCSKAVSQWLSACAAGGTTVVASRPWARNIDPESIASFQFDEAGVITALLAQLDDHQGGPHGWLDSWVAADAVAAHAVTQVLAEAAEPNEIAIACAAVNAPPPGGALVVSSSMPVRDVEWFGPNRNDIEVFANRGANGIDGIIATSIGVALSGRATVCLIGDVAFLHDASSLTALQERNVDLTIVVTNNDGGGIFSFLPQHELLDAARYEAVFGTPHGTDLAAVSRAHGLPVEAFDGAVPAPAGVRVVVAQTVRADNLALHDQVHQAVAKAVAVETSSR